VRVFFHVGPVQLHYFGFSFQEKQAQGQQACAELLVQPVQGCLHARSSCYHVLVILPFPEATCPVHVVGEMVKGMRYGERPFAEISATAALSTLREALVGIGVASAQLYRCHDLRRGHAKDLQESGAPLWAILAAGEWKSPAFLDYLDLHKLETDLVVQVCSVCHEPHLRFG